MKKIILLFFVFFSLFNISFAEELAQSDVKLPKELNLTDRYILDDLKQLRSSMESLKREIFVEIQAREMGAIEKALSYSSNAVSFFSILITILITSIGIVGWKTIGDIKRSTKESMDRETKKIIENFQEKIVELEKEQKVNILWRQYNTSESDKEKMAILDKIYSIKPDSQFALIERSNIYLSMGLYEKVIEITSIVISSNFKKHLTQALFNRACAYSALKQTENVVNDLKYLLQLSPDYKGHILESKYFENVLKNPKIKDLLN